jgi:hypothetical protein
MCAISGFGRGIIATSNKRKSICAAFGRTNMPEVTGLLMASGMLRGAIDSLELEYEIVKSRLQMLLAQGAIATEPGESLQVNAGVWRSMVSR